MTFLVQTELVLNLTPMLKKVALSRMSDRGAGAGDNEGVVGAKPLTFTASKFDFRDGNVGIGTDAPEVSLHVKGANDTTFTDSNVTLIVEVLMRLIVAKQDQEFHFLANLMK